MTNEISTRQNRAATPPDFRVLFESVPGLYLVLLPDDPIFTIVAVSDAYAAATMTKREEILGRGLFEIFPDNPANPSADGVHNLHASLVRVLNKKAADTMSVQKYDIRRPTSEGGGFEERYWSPINSPVIGEAGRIEYIIHRVEDVTEFVRLKQAGTVQDRLTDELRVRTTQVEAELFLRNRQLADAQEFIAQRQRTEEVLRENEQQLRNLADSIPQLAWMAEPNGHIFWYNRRWYEFTGATPEQMAGWGWQSVHDPEILPKVLAHWRASLNTGAPFEMEFPLRGAEGAFRWFLTRVTPFRDGQGKIVRWFGTNTDIDELRRAREEREALLRREQEARSAAELLNRLGPLLLTELDLNRLVQSVTDLATELTGAEFCAFFYNVVDEKGETYSLYTLSGAPREAFESFPMPRNTAVFGPTFHGRGVVRSDDITKDPRYGHNPPHYGMPKGHLPVTSYLAVPVVSRSGQVLGGLFFGHSAPARFTGRHEAIVIGIAAHAAIAMDNARLFEETRRGQREIQAANEELRRANSDLEQFAYSASHDLKEPLRNVAICSELIGRQCGNVLDTQAHGFLKQLMQNARRMDSLVNDLLAFTQVGGSNCETEREKTSASEALERVMTSFSNTFAELHADIGHGSLPADVRIRRIHLEQLFQNLISNALKYRSNQPPQIHLAAHVKDGNWLFSVADNGIGIPPEHQERIFGIFKRLHTADQYPGTGMGLAICKRIVERYHGRIWVESQSGHGSTFFFTLPV